MVGDRGSEGEGDKGETSTPDDHGVTVDDRIRVRGVKGRCSSKPFAESEFDAVALEMVLALNEHNEREKVKEMQKKKASAGIKDGGRGQPVW